MTHDNLPAPGAPDIDIARAAVMAPIVPLAETKFDIPAKALVPYGHFKAKLGFDYIQSLSNKPSGKLVLVTAVTPTPAGEGKTTTSVGLTDGLNRIGLKTMVCLREPSLGPVFGMKGGAAGGGRAQVIPMEDINLHFNGDFHAITSAHALISAMLDNHLQWGNALDIDPRRISWRRAIDMNDRALRNITIGMGGPTEGVVREDGFDITVASEIMAIFCLATNLKDLQARIGDIIIAKTRKKAPVTVRDLGADGAVTVLLKDAFQPNLVQTIEQNMAFIHGGPFANIAHGCNSVVATQAALKLADVVVTEAGFGADLGAEKFLNIKCRQTGLRPDALVLVCTVRAMKMQGGVKKTKLGKENVDAVRDGCVNLQRHIQNMKTFGLTPVVALNHFVHDTNAEIEEVRKACDAENVEMVISRHWAEGGAGAEDLARAVQARLDAPKTDLKLTYKDSDSLTEKVQKVAKKIYRATDIAVSKEAAAAFKSIEKMGFGHLPICIAKTQASFSTDPTQLGATCDHIVEVRDATLNAGAGFVVAICGTILRMPGLPRHPAALDIGLDDDGQIIGLA
ncbi:formate--tetrahydrofolate ligase [Litorimonas cladophorae]|uniref:Formate--tetrahydrofolate ligase n=1 Tax=Litorimonas cladophorae TaxID=1220491 RepID=A0A918KLI1_9PROT|nr:formate--tetrahydrofolate ligase [Litorimonas cladophorae]GGX65461.1 formate--tetrahydrofolate ligase [Litorimonas cladophorae]